MRTDAWAWPPGSCWRGARRCSTPGARSRAGAAGAASTAVPRVDRDAFVANHVAMVEAVRAAGARAVVIGPVYRDRVEYPPEGDLIAERRARRYARPCQRVPYLEVPGLTEDSWPGNQPLFLEHIHPTTRTPAAGRERLLAFPGRAGMLHGLAAVAES